MLKKPDAAKLIENYRQVRRVEAILRRWSFAGETVLPDDPAPLYRVAVRCGWKNADEFMTALGGYREAISLLSARRGEEGRTAPAPGVEQAERVHG